LTAEVAVGVDGSGRVVAGAAFDPEAVQQIGDIGRELAVDDLVGAGWIVSQPRLDPDGFTRVRAVKEFADPEAANRTLAELGPAFAPLKVTQTQTLLRTRTSVRGVVDLSAGFESFSDPALRQALADSDFDASGFGPGPGPSHSEGPLGPGPGIETGLADAVTVSLAVDLPGATDSNGRGSPQSTQRWTSVVGETLDVSATAVNDRVALAVGGAVSASAVALMIAIILLVRHRKKSRA